MNESNNFYERKREGVPWTESIPAVLNVIISLWSWHLDLLNHKSKGVSVNIRYHVRVGYSETSSNCLFNLCQQGWYRDIIASSLFRDRGYLYCKFQGGMRVNERAIERFGN